MDTKYNVIFRGKIISYLNPAFVKERGVDDKTLDEIKVIHVTIQSVFEKIKKETNIEKLRCLAGMITELDFKLQEAWGFEKDARFHTWWYRAPKCLCGTMDNREALGTGYQHINVSCPLHGVSE